MGITTLQPSSQPQTSPPTEVAPTLSSPLTMPPAKENAGTGEEDEEMVDYDYSPPNSGSSSPAASNINALEEILSTEDSSPASTAVNLAAGDDIPWVAVGCKLLTIEDIQHAPHGLSLRTTSRQPDYQSDTKVQHEIHEALVDALAQQDTSNAIYFLVTHRRQTDATTVLTSLANSSGIIAVCLLRSTSRSQSTRSPPHWSLDLIYTKADFRSRGFCSALLRTAMMQAMFLLPGHISARSSFAVSNILTHAGFEQLGPNHHWLYRHYQLAPTTRLRDLTHTRPVGFCTDKRVCYILSTVQVICGQPEILDWLMRQSWPHMKVGYALTMLLMDYDPATRPSSCVLLAVLHSHLVKQNKSMCGHSPLSEADQDGFDLLLALFSCLDREIGPSVAPPLFHVDFEHVGTCALPSCPDESSVQTSDRVIRVWVPRTSPTPCRLEALLAQTMVSEEKEFTCVTCQHPRRKYTAAVTGASRDVAICLQRATGNELTAYHTNPVALPTQLNLTVGGVARQLHLRTVLLFCRVTTKPGVSDPHWFTVTHRRLQDNPQRSENPMWFLVSDDQVITLGNLGRHIENEVLSLDHVALKRFEDLAICGAFYSSCDVVSLPRSLPLRAGREHYTPALDDAIERLRRTGVQIAQCTRYLCDTDEELQERVAAALFTNSPVALNARYLRKALAEVDLSLRSQRIILAREDSVKSKTIDFKASLDTGLGWGHAEALDKGLQSPSLLGGSQFVHELGKQLGVTLTNPAGVVVTTNEFRTGFHFHIFPVINTGIVIGANNAEGNPWQTAGLFRHRVLKTYLFVPVTTLELLGLSVAESGSMSLRCMIERITKLPRSSRNTLQFTWAVMDGTETTHIVFPEQTLHWVATEADRNVDNAVYCGVGSYFLPNDIAAARRLRKSIDDYGHYRHTAKQKPSRLEALSLLDAHIAALEAIDSPATVNGLPPTMTSASPWHSSLSDPTSAGEHRGKLDPTCLHA